MLLLGWRKKPCGFEAVGQEEESDHRRYNSLQQLRLSFQSDMPQKCARCRRTSNPSITKIHLQLDKPPRVPISAKPRASRPPNAPESEAAV